jgi:hypothetical protein
LSVKARKSILWFLVTVLKELANEGAFLSVEERNGLFGLLDTTWPKLGSKGRRDAVVAIAISIQQHLQRRGSLSLTGPAAAPPLSAIRAATATIDTVYAGIAEESRRFLKEKPKIAGLTKEAAEAIKKPVKLSATDKLSLVFGMMGSK